MAGTTIRMNAERQNSLEKIYNKIRTIEGAEQISKSSQIINEVSIWTLVYEKYYFRTGSYTSAVIVLTEHRQKQTACIICSGGGAGVGNYSFGSNHKFATDCVRALEACGFSVIESDLDMKDKGFIERFFK